MAHYSLELGHSFVDAPLWHVQPPGLYNIISILSDFTVALRKPHILKNTVRCCYPCHAGMASADVQRRLLRMGQGVLTPAEGLAALRWVLGANERAAEPQVSCKPHVAYSYSLRCRPQCSSCVREAVSCWQRSSCIVCLTCVLLMAMLCGPQLLTTVILAGSQVVVNSFVWETYLAQLPSSDDGFLVGFGTAVALDQRDLPLASQSAAGSDREETLQVVLEVAGSITGAWLGLCLPAGHRRAKQLPLVCPPDEQMNCLHVTVLLPPAQEHQWAKTSL